MSKKTLLLPFGVLAGCALIIALLYSLKPTPPKKPNGSKQLLVASQVAQPGTYQPMVTLYGAVESPHTSTLAAANSAFVAQVNVYEGQFVEAGQLLVQLDNSDEQLRLDQRNAEVEDITAQIASEKAQHAANLRALDIEKKLLNLSQKAADRYENLVQKQVGSDVTRDEALQSVQRQALSLNTRQLQVTEHPIRIARLEAQLAKASAMRAQAEVDLARSQITAPFKGRVTRLFVAPRDRLRQNDPIIELYDTDTIEVRAQIPVRYLKSVRDALQQGRTLPATLKHYDEAAPAELVRIAGAVGTGKGGLDGFFKPTNHSAMELGLAVEIQLSLPELDNVVAVPPQAIYGQDRIYQIRDEHLQGIQISRVGETRSANNDALILVKGNIEKNSAILITQLPNAITGLKVSTVANE